MCGPGGRRERSSGLQILNQGLLGGKVEGCEGSWENLPGSPQGQSRAQKDWVVAQPNLKEHLLQAGVKNEMPQLLTEPPSEGCLWILSDFSFAPVECLQLRLQAGCLGFGSGLSRLPQTSACPERAPVSQGLLGLLLGSPLPFIRVYVRQSPLGKEEPPGYLKQSEFIGYPGD